MAEQVGEDPIVSVVVTTRDRAGQLEELLGALEGQTLSCERFEVVVVNDGSTDGTDEVLRRFKDAGRLRLTLIERDAPGGAAIGREVGWRKSRGGLVAFTDDDCVPDANWLEVMGAAAKKNPGSVLQGRTSPRTDQLHRTSPYSRTMNVQTLSPHFPTTNIAYPRELLERINGFDIERYRDAVGGEDTDLGWRAVAAGSPPEFIAESHVFHAVNVLGPKGKLKVAGRVSAAIPFADHPESRSEFILGVFRKRTHLRWLAALVGLALARPTRGLSLAFALPYARELRARGLIEGGGLVAAPFFALHDTVEVQATVRAGIRAGRLMV